MTDILSTILFCLDHFIPWARLPDDGLHNLVPAHRGCNNSKRDYLASAAHLARWLDRTTTQQASLRDIAASSNWELDPSRARGIARSVYGNLPADMLLWQQAAEPDQFVPLDGAAIRVALSA